MNIDEVTMTGKDVFKTIWKHPKKCLNWFGINIGVGLLSLWLVLVLHYFSQQIPFERAVGKIDFSFKQYVLTSSSETKIYDDLRRVIIE